MSNGTLMTPEQLGQGTQTHDQFSSDINDLPASYNYNVHRLSVSVAVDMTGIANPRPGRRVTLVNTGAWPITLRDNDGRSISQNRLATPSNADVVIRVGEAIDAVYDEDQSGGRWRVGDRDTASAEDAQQWIPIWAEENAALASSTYEWAFGNGANTPSGGGPIIPFDYEVVAMGLTTGSAGTCTVEARRNGSLFLTAAQVTTTAQTNNYVTFSAGSRPQGNVGDRFNFRTSSASGSGSPCVVIAWIRPR